MIDRRATFAILVLATAAACGGLWLQRRLQPRDATEISSPAALLKIGDRAGDFALPDLDGKPQRLSQWRGKRVLLNFWATWCGPCREEMPQLSAAQMQHPEVQVVGIALDQPQAVREYLRRTQVAYPVLIGIDADPPLPMVFGDRAGLLPFSVLVGPQGQVLRTHLGPLSPAQLADWLDSRR